MRKWIALALVPVLLFGFSACSSNENQDNTEKSAAKQVAEKTIPETTKETVPKIDTFSISVEELITKLNNSSELSKTWDTSNNKYTHPDGTTGFVCNDTPIGCVWNGISETESEGIIKLEITSVGNESMVACAGATFPMMYLLGIDKNEAIELWVKAENEGTAYSGSAKITVSDSTGNIVTVISQKNYVG